MMPHSAPASLIQVICPYCGNQFAVKAPTDTSLQYPDEPHEVECVAYTRDIGRFDPKEEADWLSHKGWSRIGKDYFTLLSYEKIGILRVEDPCINIWYRAQGCPTCRNFFDVYANYTEKDGTHLELSHLWPHVFAKPNPSSSDISLYQGESWPFWLTRQFSRLVGHSRTGGSILISILLFCFGLIPWLFVQPSSQWGLFVVQTLLHLVAIVSVCLVLVISSRYIKYLDNAADFYETLAVREKRSVHHWLNYTRSRIVGFQGSLRFPRLTQVDVFAGGGGVLSLIFTWAVVNHSWFIASIGAILLFAVLVIFIDFRGFLKGRLSSLHELKWLKLVVVVAALVLASIVWLIVHPNLNWSMLNQAVDLLFWIFIAYLLGTGTLFTESIASYVLMTIRRIPMHLSPYNQYEQIKPLRRIQSYSTWTILLLFLTIIFITGIIITFQNLTIGALTASTSFRQAAFQFNWLVIWMSLALAFIFVGLGLGRGKIYFVVISIFYLVLYFITPAWNPVIAVGTINPTSTYPLLNLQRIEISLQGQLLVVGAFLTFLLVQHLLTTDKIITTLIEDSRKKNLDSIDQQITKVNENLQKLNQNPAQAEEQHLKELQCAVETLEHLVELRKEVKQSRDRPKFRLIQLISPIISSVVLPVLLEIAIFPLFE